MNDDDGFSHNSNDFFLFVLDFYWKKQTNIKVLEKATRQGELKGRIDQQAVVHFYLHSDCWKVETRFQRRERQSQGCGCRRSFLSSFIPPTVVNRMVETEF